MIAGSVAETFGPASLADPRPVPIALRWVLFSLACLSAFYVFAAAWRGVTRKGPQRPLLAPVSQQRPGRETRTLTRLADSWTAPSTIPVPSATPRAPRGV
jgi:hypothetical protein